MMHRRKRFFFTVVALAIGVLTTSGFDRTAAAAALRVTVTSGATTDYFYSTNPLSLSTGTFTINGFITTVETTLTNFSGGLGLGTISSNVGTKYTSAVNPGQLTVLAEVIQDVSGMTTGLVAAGDVAAVAAAVLAPWTDPTSPLYAPPATVDAILAYTGQKAGTIVTVDSLYGQTPGTLTTVTATKTVTTSPVDGGGTSNTTLGVFNAYYLSSRITLSNVLKSNRPGGITATGTTNVTNTNLNVVVPEPALMTMAISGLPLLGLGLWLRRRTA